MKLDPPDPPLSDGTGLEFVRLQLMMLPDNDGSARVAAKAGFVEEGLLRAYAKQRGAIRTS
jgi:RimJ/RimL family protein N-acetyltransferase